jgi:surface carbohydrate biosynthesis protein (TIGR04326 family)
MRHSQSVTLTPGLPNRKTVLIKDDKKMRENLSMVLLDESGQWNGDARVIAHWTKLNVFPHQVSIPQKVEEQALLIKKDYIAWVYDLGQYKINNQTLTSYLKFFENFSFWWMTKIAAKSPFLSPDIYHVFKLRALEQLYFKQECEGLIYCGNNQTVHQILQDWCQKLGHPYQRISEKKFHIKSEWTGINKIIFNLPFWFQAFLYLVRNWFMSYRHIRPNNLNKKQNSIKNHVTIVTWFPNIDMGKAKAGRFYSHLWEDFHQLLDELPHEINWVWLYSKSGQATFKEAVFLRDKCNQHSPEKYRHFLLEEFFTPEIFVKCIKSYLKFYSKGIRLKEIKKAFCFPDSKLNFFPILRHDWNSSLFGKDAMESIVYSFLFDSMAQVLPANPWGLFIFENQPHESALISAWKRNQKKTKVFANQHTTIRPMDLRPLYDARIFKAPESERPPIADKLGLNGPNPYSVLKESQYPIEKFAKVEALRYSKLLGRHGSEKKGARSSGRTLLVTTALLDHEIKFQLELLNEAASQNGLTAYKKILIKNHPDFPVDKYLKIIKPKFQFTLTSQPLNELWPISDVIYCSNTTSIVIEAGYLGIPVIITGQDNYFNLNPLYGSPSVNFVTNSKMLCEELESPTRINIPDDYFYLDNKMTLWKKLLHDQKTA